MNRTLIGLFAAATVAGAVLFAPRPALADVQTLEGGCTFKTGADCSATCTTDDFSVVCDGDLAIQCQGMCSGTAQASCEGSCQGSCTAQCNANPGEFTCSGECSADCDTHCMAECQASTDGATSQGDCVAKCDGCCKARCEGSCQAQPPTATCDAKCQASCQGDCTAQANFKCQVSCAASQFPTCTANYKASCSGKCSAQGVVVCNGAVQQFVNDVNAAVNWVKQHVTYSAEASGSCSGNTCSGQASASAKCAVTTVGADGEVPLGVGGALAMVGVAAGARRRRSRR